MYWGANVHIHVRTLVLHTLHDIGHVHYSAVAVYVLSITVLISHDRLQAAGQSVSTECVRTYVRTHMYDRSTNQPDAHARGSKGELRSS
jgi:hypothetical protein